MATLHINKFRGIRAVNPIVDVVSAGEISAVSTKNVELKFSENGANFGIYTMQGNTTFFDYDSLWSGCTLIDSFSSVQSGVEYIYAYLTLDNEGRIYRGTTSGTFELLKEGLTAVDQANGITIAQGFDDWFVFTNGVDRYQAFTKDRSEEIYAVDSEGREIKGLGLKTYDGRLVAACDNRVHWSKVSDIFNWNETTAGVYTNPAFQELDRQVTGMEYYNNALVVFTDTYSVEFRGNPANALDFTKTGATGGGTPSFNSMIKFDNKLYYYDNIAKNIFAYYLYDTGQTRPTDGLANNINYYLDQISFYDADKIKLKALIQDDRSEIWMLLPTNEGQELLILDYLKGEYLEREMQDITGMCLIGGQMYTCSGSKLLKEYSSMRFDGEFKPCEYVTNIINLGSDSDLKIPKYPLILTLDSSYINNFYIEFTYDDQEENKVTKRIEKRRDRTMIWAVDNNDPDNERKWSLDNVDINHGVWDLDSSRNLTYNLYGLIPFKQLQMRIFTLNEGDDFGIKRMEIKRVGIKTKTVG